MSTTPPIARDPGGRRLAAVMFTDVVGYSARMQADEAGTLALVKSDFARIGDLCVQRGGEVLNSMGDGLLVCFPSVVEAVACALQVQAEFSHRPRVGTVGALEHRIGIHLGDIFRDGSEVAGDGVNIASRLETKARPGTICLSKIVYDSVKGKIDMQVESLGPQQLKNITDPIEAFLVAPIGARIAAARPSGLAGGRAWLGAGLVAAAVVLATVFWPKSAPTMAAPAAPSPDAKTTRVAAPKNSLAVLPFTNMSEAKENAFFADGVHEDLLTELANVGGLLVISRTSVMQYRDTTKPLRQIAMELGVAFILEGSVQRSGNKVRVTGQLINALTDEHVWAKSYDRDLTDVFAIQAELSRSIAKALQVVLNPTDDERLDKRPTKNMAAYDLYEKAREVSRTGANLNDQKERALPLLESAVELDPNYADAWVEIFEIELSDYGYEDNTDARLAKARAALAQAERIAPDDVAVLMAGSELAAMTHDRATVSKRRARIIELYPNRPEALLARSLTAGYEHKWDESVAFLERAVALDPRNPVILGEISEMYWKLRRYGPWMENQLKLHRLAPDDLMESETLAFIPFLARGSTSELNAFLEQLPPDPEFLNSNEIIARAQALFCMGDAEGFVQLWRSAGPHWKFTGERHERISVAQALTALGQTSEARTLLERDRDELQLQLKDEQENVGKLNDLGLVQAMLGERGEARETLSRVRVKLGLSPTTPHERQDLFENECNRGWAGEKEESISEMSRLLKLGPMYEANVYMMRSSLAFLPLQDEPAFKAAIADPANNAPF